MQSAPACCSRRRAVPAVLTVALLVTLFPLALVAAPALAVGSARPCTEAVTPLDRVSFQPTTAPASSGYRTDPGQAFDGTLGWVAADGAALSLEGQAVDRNVWSAQHNDTLIVLSPSTGRFEYAVANGRYEVTVAMGDPVVPSSARYLASVEGVPVIDHVPTTSARMAVGTACIDVADGRITVDPTASTKGRIQWVAIGSVATDARRVVETDPPPGATAVSTTASVTITTSHPIDRTTVDAASFQVLAPSGTVLSGTYNSDGAGGVAGFTPSAALAPNTTYTIRTTEALKDDTGVAFEPYTGSFRTGVGGTASANVNFDRIPLDNVTGPTVVTFGPDGKLYVGTTLGEIRRYTLTADGGLAGPAEVFKPFGAFQKIVLGIAFAPGSTASNLRLYVTTNVLGFGDNIPNFSGTVALVTGTSTGPLTKVRDVIVGLPRSAKDHMTNAAEFGPDGRLYVTQGSMTGYGAPDNGWKNRPEVPLAAAVLVADVLSPSFPATVDVNTDRGYDYVAASAPVRVFADGVRNAYDLTWDAAGNMWAPVNEAARGDIPANTQPQNQGEIEGVGAGHDFVAQIKPGRYYGHPNPSYTEYESIGTRILNGGNPTAGPDPWEVPAYAVGIVPEVRWDPPVVDLGLHRSANGIDLYAHDAFGAELRDKLVITEYSGGDDIIALDTATGAVRQVAGGFFNPLDLRVDRRNGRIYLAEYGSDPEGQGGRLTLLRPNPAVTTSPVARLNFQPANVPVPAGYTAESGLAFSSSAGRGWVAAGTTTPLSLTAETRDRNVFDDRNQLQDTLIHMQGASGAGDFLYAVGTGTYDVTVSVGDAGNKLDSRHTVVVEGATAVESLVPTSTDRFRGATVRVSVSDGFLTVSAGNGQNTKLNYLDINRVGEAEPPPPPPPPPTTFAVETPLDRFGLSTRIVLSTMNHEPSAPASFTIRNTGADVLSVTGLAISGANAADFVLNTGQPSSFTVAPGATAPVSVRFVPRSTAYANRFAILTVRTNAGDAVVRLRAVDHSRAPGTGGIEPSLQQLVSLFGFAIDTGVTGPNQATGPGPVGDEVLVPYFERADRSRPVQLIPIARYVAATTAASASGSTPYQSATQRREYGFPTDVMDDPNTPEDETVFNQNQKVMPSIVGTTTLNVGNAGFGLHGNFSNYSDDRFNVDPDTGTRYHNLRIYPVKDQDARPVPNAWLVGVDIKVDVSKNYDYQDQIMVLLNAKPYVPPPPAPLPGDAAVRLDFSAPVAGTVADRDGEGTGFTQVQANTAGNEYLAALIDLDPTAGELVIGSDAGKNSGASNTQRNALEVVVDTRTGTTVTEAVLRSPGVDVTKPFQQKAVYFGPDQDNYVKLEIERRNDPNGTYLTLFREVNRATGLVAKVALANPGSIGTLTLRLSAVASTGKVAATYSVDGAAFKTLGTYTVGSGARPLFFNARGAAGILTSHTAPTGQTNQPVIARYDSFRVVRPSQL